MMEVSKAERQLFNAAAQNPTLSARFAWLPPALLGVIGLLQVGLGLFQSHPVDHRAVLQGLLFAALGFSNSGHLWAHRVSSTLIRKLRDELSERGKPV